MLQDQKGSELLLNHLWLSLSRFLRALCLGFSELLFRNETSIRRIRHCLDNLLEKVECLRVLDCLLAIGTRFRSILVEIDQTTDVQMICLKPASTTLLADLG